MPEISTVRTIRLKNHPNILWLELETDDGLKGLGETWRCAGATEAVLHEEIAPWLLGRNASQIELISKTLLESYVGFHSSGAETRAASAVDIALWDLMGKRNDIPVYEALGGHFREMLPVYNTCSGYLYNSKGGSINCNAQKRQITDSDQSSGPYDDQIAFMRNAGELAESLVREGFHGMKIWPFDSFAINTNGNFISEADLQTGLEPFRQIRRAVGDRIEIQCELHSLWNYPSALRILKALEEFHVLWAEDPINKMDDYESLRRLRESTSTPICGSETLSGKTAFKHLLDAKAVSYVMLDLGWCGGISEGLKIAHQADANNLPISPHDCTGPVLLWAATHLAFHCSNTIYQEVVRAHLHGWYPEMVDALPIIKNGYILLPKAPGLGVQLKNEVKQRNDVIIRESSKQ